MSSLCELAGRELCGGGGKRVREGRRARERASKRAEETASWRWAVGPMSESSEEVSEYVSVSGVSVSGVCLCAMSCLLCVCVSVCL